jgi:hypothetical protein
MTCERKKKDYYRFTSQQGLHIYSLWARLSPYLWRLIHRCDWRSCHNRGGILDASRKIHRKIHVCVGLLFGCHSIPLWSDCDHDFIALFGTLGFECECLIFPIDVELYDHRCITNRGSGGTQDGCLSLDTAHSWETILEYHKVQRHDRIPDSRRDIFYGCHWNPDQLIRQL